MDAGKGGHGRHAPVPRPPHGNRWRSLAAAVVLAVLAGSAALVWAAAREPSRSASDPGPVHVHGLGLDPADGSLFIATHSGLWRVGSEETKATRVGARLQDTMGFTIVGPNRFLASGHPDLREARDQGLPPRLGLIESTDAGETWTSISLSGDADLHVLRQQGEQLIAYDASNDRLLASRDRGRTWSDVEKPGQIVDVAIDPADGQHLVATVSTGLTEGLFESRDGGASWDRVGARVGLLAWPVPDSLVLVTDDGSVFRSRDRPGHLERRGTVESQPAALLATDPDDLYVALHDGSIERSTDGGRSWTVRSRP